MVSNILELSNITKQYKAFKLDKVSFSIGEGSICGFVGINGAGKSTTVKIIEGLVGKDEGVVTAFGETRLTPEIKELIGFVPDSCYFYEKRKIRDLRKSISGMYKNWDEAAYKKYIEFFNLDENKKIGELSKGMKMQLSLTFALSHKAKLLIMDEPTSGLDPYIRNQVMSILKEYVSDGTNSVLFSTHIMSDLEKTADKVVFIHRGKVVFEENFDKLPELFSTRYGIQWTTLDECVVACIEKIQKGETADEERV